VNDINIPAGAALTSSEAIELEAVKFVGQYLMDESLLEGKAVAKTVKIMLKRAVQKAAEVGGEEGNKEGEEGNNVLGVGV